MTTPALEFEDARWHLERDQVLWGRLRNETEEKKAVVLLSGGVDSTTLLWFLRESGWQCHPLAVNYGQRHARELESARKIAEKFGAPLQIADISNLRSLLKGSSQTDAVPVPEGHYADPAMKVTVVPNRNMIMLSIAAGHAISSGVGFVAYAAHAGDHPIYPDCRPEFIERLNSAMQLCHYDPVSIVAPFKRLKKGHIVSIGLHLHAPYELTWSCYKEGDAPCGVCGTCVERAEAFQEAGVSDPALGKAVTQ